MLDMTTVIQSEVEGSLKWNYNLTQYKMADFKDEIPIMYQLF